MSLAKEMRVIENTLLYVIKSNIDTYYDGGGYAFHLGFLAEQTGLHKDVVRGLCRSLTDQGLCFYMKGLWSEDGIPAGAGYGITKAGMQRLDAILKVAA